MTDDARDPLAAFLLSDVWADEAVPRFRRELRSLEQQAIVTRDPEKLRVYQIEHALLKRLMEPAKLLAWLRAKPRPGTADEGDGDAV